MSLNITKFVNVCSHLAFEAATIIRDVYNSKNLGKVMKGVNDPVTEADLKVQTLIIQGLRKVWPTLNIVGEESTEFKGEFYYNLENIEKDIFPSAAFDNAEINIDQACVWIDPLDGTLNYTKGELDCVTTLIGLSYQNKARVGILGMPFKLGENRSFVFDPKILVGDAAVKRAYIINNTMQYVPISFDKQQKTARIVTSDNIRDKDKELLLNTGYQLHLKGGSGKKMSMISLGEIDAMAYLGCRTSKWDTCAGEAIIKAAGGYMYDIHGKDMIYDPKNPDRLNYGGIVGGSREELVKDLLIKLNVYKY